MTRTQTRTLTETRTEPSPTLARAEKFFVRKNFIVALREFEKSGLAGERPDISKKIAVCKQEIAAARVRDLTNRGRRHLAKQKIRKALGCFEEAYGQLTHCGHVVTQVRQLAPGPWLRDQIDAIQGRLRDTELLESARAAERSGDHAGAAQQYSQASARTGDEALELRRAHCLVQAEEYALAAAAFERLQPTSLGALYDQGFALAQTGHPGRALEAWQRIDSQAPAFVQQRHQVLELAARHLLARFDQLTQPRHDVTSVRQLGEERAELYVEARRLIDGGYRGSHAAPMAALVEHCAEARVEALWREGHFEESLRVLRSLTITSLPSSITPQRLALLAKCLFKLTKPTAADQEDFIACWLTALHCDEILECLSPVDDERDQIRDLLLEWGQARLEDLTGGLRRVSDQIGRQAEAARARWQRESERLRELQRAIGARACQGLIIGTPRFAEIADNSDQVLELIRASRQRFDSEECYLEMGSAYSSAGPSLRRLAAGESTEALALLPRDAGGDTFVTYGIRKVRFGYGLWCLESGTGNPVPHFQDSHELLAKAPGLEHSLVERIAQVEGRKKLRRYEEVLAAIHRRRASPELGKALALVMTRRALEESRWNQVSLRTAQNNVRRALALDPDNEEARLALDDITRDLELIELDHALNRHKMNRACALAAGSSFEEVREELFACLGSSVAAMHAEGLPPAEALAFLREVEQWCCMVDETHALRYEVASAIEGLTAQRASNPRAFTS